MLAIGTKGHLGDRASVPFIQGQNPPLTDIPQGGSFVEGAGDEPGAVRAEGSGGENGLVTLENVKALPGLGVPNRSRSSLERDEPAAVGTKNQRGDIAFQGSDKFAVGRVPDTGVLVPCRQNRLLAVRTHQGDRPVPRLVRAS